MADETKDNAEQGKRKLPLKTIISMAAVLLVEAAVISAVFIFSKQPTTAEADSLEVGEKAQAEQPVEVLVVTGRYQNTRRGVGYTYDTEVYIVIKKKFKDDIAKQIEQMLKQIDMEVATIFRRAEPSYLREPDLATVRRQIKEALDQRFGVDPETNEPIVQKVLIPKCMEHRSDL